jgi:hypothetical protein
VIEDKFVGGCRPTYEVAGAMMVENVHVYEMMKIRVLNGGHSAISCRTPSPPTHPRGRATQKLRPRPRSTRLSWVRCVEQWHTCWATATWTRR